MAKKGQIGPNGYKYSDGRYSIDGTEKWRTKPGGAGKKHTGIDIPAAIGDPVYAAATGTVSYSGNIGDYGLVVILKHNDGTITMYAHLSQSFVTTGKGLKYSVSKGKVEIGDIIGKVGTNGNGINSGSHLHFEAMKWPTAGYLGEKMDPKKWIDFGGMKAGAR